MKVTDSILTKATIALLFIMLLFYSIIIAKHLLMVLVLSILFSYLLHPLVIRLEMLRFPRFLANLVSILLLISIFTSVIFLFYKQMEHLLGDLPELKQKALHNIDQLELYIEEISGVETIKQKIWLKESVNSLFETGSNFLKTSFSATTATLAKMFVLPVFIYYILYYRQKYYTFLFQIIPVNEKHAVANILKRISRMVQRYIIGVFTVVLILSILNTLGLLIVGLKYAVIFGIISAFFNFIPYFGTWIGASIPLTFALLTGDTINTAIGVLILFIIIQFLENNILTPNITGGYVDINPFITILSIIIGGMIWGITGMFVILPIIGTIKIICEHYPSYNPIAYLISNQQERKYLTKKRRVIFLWKKISNIFKTRV